MVRVQYCRWINGTVFFLNFVRQNDQFSQQMRFYKNCCKNTTKRYGEEHIRFLVLNFFCCITNPTNQVIKLNQAVYVMILFVFLVIRTLMLND